MCEHVSPQLLMIFATQVGSGPRGATLVGRPMDPIKKPFNEVRRKHSTRPETGLKEVRPSNLLYRGFKEFTKLFCI